METKTLKAIGIVFIGLLIWVGIFYVAIAFIKSEPNPFLWTQFWRGVLVYAAFCYLAFTPLMVNELKY
jgi:hypothetical protein